MSQGKEYGDCSFQFTHRTATALMQINRDISKKALNPVHPQTGGRREMHLETFVLLQPRLHFRMLVGEVGAEKCDSV